MSCTGDDPFRVSWTEASGHVDTYKLYYTPGNWNPCIPLWTATGSRRLLGSYPGDTAYWIGHLSPEGGKVSVVAVNAGGSSSPVYSTPVDLTEWTCG